MSDFAMWCALVFGAAVAWLPREETKRDKIERWLFTIAAVAFGLNHHQQVLDWVLGLISTYAMIHLAKHWFTRDFGDWRNSRSGVGE